MYLFTTLFIRPFISELHDCFSANELITYEALGLCPIGKVYNGRKRCRFDC